MEPELNTLYKNNITLYKTQFKNLLQISDAYLNELIMFITLSEFLSKSYYPPFEIKTFITKLHQNNYPFAKIVLSDNPLTQISFQTDLFEYFHIESKCTYAANINVFVIYGINIKDLTVSNLTKLDDFRQILFEKFNLDQSYLTIKFSNKFLTENLTLGEYFINNLDKIYLYSLQSA